MNWRDIGERALKTFAQTLAATLTVEILTDAELLKPALLAAVLAGLLSVLTSIGSSHVGDNSPSLVAPVSMSPIDGDPDGLDPIFDDETAEAAKHDA